MGVDRAVPADVRDFGLWQTVYDRFTRRRDAGAVQALMDGLIAEAARAHHDAAGMRGDEQALSCLEKSAETPKGSVKE